MLITEPGGRLYILSHLFDWDVLVIRKTNFRPSCVIRYTLEGTETRAEGTSSNSYGSLCSVCESPSPSKKSNAVRHPA